MKKIFILSLICLVGQFASGQVVSKGALIGNSGQFGNSSVPVVIGFYNKTTFLTDTVATINTDGVQDILQDGRMAFVAASDSIYKMDIINKSIVARQEFKLPSTVKLALYNDYVLVGNFYGATVGNLRAYDKADLSFVDSAANVDLPAKDFLVIGDTAYITQNLQTGNFKDSAGFLRLINLTDFSLIRDETFTNNNEDLGRLFLRGDTIYGINNATNSISKYNWKDRSKSTIASNADLNSNVYGSSGGFSMDTFYVIRDSGFAGLSLHNGQSMGPVNNVISHLKAISVDTVDHKIYGVSTNYASAHAGGIFNSSKQVGQFNVTFACEEIEVVYNHKVIAMDDYYIDGQSSTTKAYFPYSNDVDPDGDPSELAIFLKTPPVNHSAQIKNDSLIVTYNIPPFANDSLQYGIIDAWGDTSCAWVYLESWVGVPNVTMLSQSVYPNPSHQSLHIDFKSFEAPVGFQIFNIQGAMMQAGMLDGRRNTLDIRNLTPGQYFLLLSNEESIQQSTFIKL